MRKLSQDRSIIPDEEGNVVQMCICLLFTSFLLVNAHQTFTKKLSYYLHDIIDLWSYNWAEAIYIEQCKDHVNERENGGKGAFLYMVRCPIILMGCCPQRSPLPYHTFTITSFFISCFRTQLLDVPADTTLTTHFWVGTKYNKSQDL